MAENSNPYQVGQAALAAPSTEADLGKTLVRVSAGLFVLTSAAVTVMLNLMYGTERLPHQIVRFGVTCLLARYLVQGIGWARWTSVGLYGLGVLGMFAVASRDVGLLALQLGYLVAILLLVVPRSVRTFFAQRAR